jgi:hypothetical protein
VPEQKDYTVLGRIYGRDLNLYKIHSRVYKLFLEAVSNPLHYFKLTHYPKDVLQLKLKKLKIRRHVTSE